MSEVKPRCLHVDYEGIRCKSSPHQFGPPGTVGFYGPYCQQHEKLHLHEWIFCCNYQPPHAPCDKWVKVDSRGKCDQTAPMHLGTCYLGGSHAVAEGLFTPNQLACPKCKAIPLKFRRRAFYLDNTGKNPTVTYVIDCYSCKRQYSVSRGEYVK